MATEKRLIDANAWLKRIRIEASNYENNFYDEWKNGIFLGLDKAIDEIEDSPTVDAVEVVRCKDCRFWHKDTVSCDFVTADTNWYAEDFCSYGERKDNG